jgi:hypothetical protein
LNLHASSFLDLLVVTRDQRQRAQAVLAILRESGTDDAGPKP